MKSPSYFYWFSINTVWYNSCSPHPTSFSGVFHVILAPVAGMVMEQILLKALPKHVKDSKATGNSQHRFTRPGAVSRVPNKVEKHRALHAVSCHCCKDALLLTCIQLAAPRDLECFSSKQFSLPWAQMMLLHRVTPAQRPDLALACAGIAGQPISPAYPCPSEQQPCPPAHQMHPPV